MADASPPPVFHDPAGRRWPRLRGVAWALGVLATILLAGFVASVLSRPLVPPPHLLPDEKPPRPQLPPLPPGPSPGTHAPPLPPSVRRALEVLRREEARARVRPARRPRDIQVAPPPSTKPPLAPPSLGPVRAAFYVNWDDASLASLERNLAHLDWLVPEWARLVADPVVRRTRPVDVKVDPRALDLVRRERPQLPVLPLVQNFHDEKWDGPLVAETLADGPSRARLVRSLVELVEENHFAGLVLDLEEVPPAAQPALLKLLEELHAALAPQGLLLGEAVPFDDEDWGYAEHAARADRLFLMAYDQHWSTSGPGPVAGEAWFEEKLAARVKEVDPAKLLLCFGGYGYDWAVDGKGAEATVISFQDAMRAAHDAEVEVAFDPASRNPVVRYEEEDGTRHEAWFLDGVTAWNELASAERAHLGGYALWRLGVEDPSLWSFYRGGPATPADPPPIEAIQFPYDVDFEGGGEILQVVAEPRAGRRSVVRDLASGRITDEKYTSLPSAYEVERSGAKAGRVALTFDDGPDPKYTPAILEVLAQKGVHATFFVIGEKGAERPDLLRRIVAEGHELGNHTYTHPNLGESSPLVTDLELNATQRLLEAMLDRRTALFRPPYFGDAEPQTPAEVDPIVRAQRLGYVAVGLRVDTNDWALPGADAIVRSAVAGATASPDEGEGPGHVVLLHDGGGDRAETVAALPRLVDALREKGLTLVPVSELAGLSRDRAMPPAPPLPPSEEFYRLADRAVFRAVAVLAWWLRWLFAIGLVAGLARTIFVTLLAVVEKRRFRRARPPLPTGAGGRPLRVSILVPAFNEEKVIVRTVESLLASDHPDFEILVLDDGSKDATYKIVSERFADEPRVRAFTKPNSGKADTLAFGLERAGGQIIIALDADTIFPPDAIGELVRPLSDERVGAVAGNAKVGNRINLVTRWQALEYVASQNLDRRAFHLLDCITVVPGAVGAWRRTVLEALGGFRSDTLAEDQDLTIQVRRRGHRIAYAERAVAWTEAPDGLRALAKQRFRWSFGTLQCMWKHRDALFRRRAGTLGWVAMPNVWLFQILFPLLSPLVDLLLVGAIAWAVLERIEHPAVSALPHLQPVLFWAAFFLVVDWLSAAVAFLLEREQWSLLFWFLLQRVCYRQVMYLVMLRSVVAALRGGLVGWGKLERKATVRAA